MITVEMVPSYAPSTAELESMNKKTSLHWNHNLSLIGFSKKLRGSKRWPSPPHPSHPKPGKSSLLANYSPVVLALRGLSHPQSSPRGWTRSLHAGKGRWCEGGRGYSWGSRRSCSGCSPGLCSRVALESVKISIEVSRVWAFREHCSIFSQQQVIYLLAKRRNFSCFFSQGC